MNASLTITAKNVNVALNGKRILRDISLSFFGPGLYFVMGANGSGKSTLMKTLAGLLKFSGEIIIGAKPITSYKRKELARLIAYVWQNPLYGFFETTVYREITFILRNLKLPLANANKYIDYFELKHFLQRSPFTLSGGEAKRVSITSVIVGEQPIWLLDEPESELDFDGLKKLVELIKQESIKRLIIIATHNTLLAHKLRAITRGIAFIQRGTLLLMGTPNKLDDSNFLAKIGLVPLNWWLS